MSVSIRFPRMGRKALPFYRLVVADSRKSRDGKYLEKLGHYDPMQKDDKDKVSLDRKKIIEWIAKGAQPTNSVGAFLSSAGIYKDIVSEKPPKTKKKIRKKKFTPVKEMLKRKEEQKKTALESKKKLEASSKKKALDKAPEEKKEQSQSEKVESSSEKEASPTTKPSASPVDTQPKSDVKAEKSDLPKTNDKSEVTE